VISYLEPAKVCGSQTWYVYDCSVSTRSTELTHTQGPDELFETVSQALLNAVDRDALSGWGAHVYIIEKDKVTKRLLKGRQD